VSRDRFENAEWVAEQTVTVTFDHRAAAHAGFLPPEQAFELGARQAVRNMESIINTALGSRNPLSALEVAFFAIRDWAKKEEA